MSILIDRDQMCVRYRHDNNQVIWNLMAIEFTHTSCVSMDENNSGSYERFTDYELKMLYLNLCGQKYTGYARDLLIGNVKTLVQSLPQADVNGLELSIQAGRIQDTEFYYRYARGSMVPQKVEEQYNPPALTSVAGYVPAPITTPAPNAAPASATQAASTFAPAPRPGTIVLPAEAPKAGSKTGRVWEIAEAQWKQKTEEAERFNRILDVKSLRKEIIELCEKEGINSSTASVQHGKWKSTKLF